MREALVPQLVRGAIVVLVASSLWACNAPSPPGWRVYDAGLITFMGPPDLEHERLITYESYSAHWSGARLRVYMGVSDRFGGGLAMGVRGRKLRVNFRPGVLYVDERGIAPGNPIGKPQVGFEGSSGFSMLVECDSVTDVPDAIALVNSIKYTGLK